MFYKISRSTLINAVIKYLNFRRSASKLESIACKFTKSRIPSEVFFFWRISLQVQNNDIEKCIEMAASGDNFIFEIILNGCFSKTAAKIYLEILGYTFYISYSVMLKGHKCFFKGRLIQIWKAPDMFVFT